MPDEWNYGADLLLMGSESVLDSLELELDSSEESNSSEELQETLTETYSTGHFYSYNDFITIGFNGVMLGFALSCVLFLIDLGANALINILRKGVN